MEAITEGQNGTIFVDETPFYATMGGQEGDTGIIWTEDAEFTVTNTIKLLGGKIGHVGNVTKGMFKVGDSVTLKVAEKERANTCKNHSATHLLQKALKTVLGSHVEQKGSLVTPDRLRFDFAHFSAMTPEELEKVENIVNTEIAKNVPVVTEVMNIEQAKATGAMASVSYTHLHRKVSFFFQNRNHTQIQSISRIFFKSTDTTFAEDDIWVSACHNVFC